MFEKNSESCGSGSSGSDEESKEEETAAAAGAEKGSLSAMRAQNDATPRKASTASLTQFHIATPTPADYAKAKLMLDYDKDKDGRITRDEWMSHFKTCFAQTWSLDTVEDLRLDLEVRVFGLTEEGAFQLNHAKLAPIMEALFQSCKKMPIAHDAKSHYVERHFAESKIFTCLKPLSASSRVCGVVLSQCSSQSRITYEQWGQCVMLMSEKFDVNSVEAFVQHPALLRLLE
jgi:hypothetical protein